MLFDEARELELRTKSLELRVKNSELRIENFGDGKILATVFWEPSTRTRFSFETAMLKLGGKVISNYSMETSSSITKGETLYDTAKTISSFADIIAMRHPKEGAVAEFAKGSSVPVINAGDGSGDHPTQALLDIYTIWKWRNYSDFKSAFGELTIGMVGDLKNSRVVHSQIELLKFFGCKFILVAPNALKLPQKYKDLMKENHCEFSETENLEKVIGDFDVLSDTRIQQERFESEEEFKKYRTFYQIDKKMMTKAKQEMIVIAPLPRFGELLEEVDSDPRAKYFEQVRNGVIVRMALIKGMIK
ncbi:aspartate carbamoyltransferase [Candidatus Peregrinibacteria bacterium RIFOXYB2_FULL_33_20]|nr:MAG: aspartate carbamoyltransferase [Candidatus Peregrinibacteria bacterium RIFOXYA2_FULL_33_21]OGJ51430.1 MAG: aspartate carbamoyltransferase [Candidatus Peregrinibacteria bacterium RIFOXYB2_FULL_33_20]